MPEQGDIAALNAYLNAALREGWLADARFVDSRFMFSHRCGGTVEVAVRARSHFRTLFEEPLALDGRPVAVAELLSHLAESGGATFRARVGDSLAALRAAPPVAGEPEAWSFVAAEQALKAGHPHHPNPRSRDEMAPAEATVYAPEHEGRFTLLWVGVDRDYVALSEGATARFAALAHADGAPEAGARLALPWHPWQAERLRALEPVRRIEAEGGLRVLGAGRHEWAATASMRGLHAWHVPYMLKVSLSLRLTNSLRDLSLREVRRGLHVSALLESSVGAEIREAFPRLTILGEPGYAALRDAAGAPLAPSIVVLRDNPFRDSAAAGPVMLASLCEAGADGRSPLVRLVRRRGVNGPEATARAWFRRFLTEAIWPLLEIRARWGLLFGAHQQNLMLVLRDGWPAGAVVRDCQGTGHLTDFHERLARVCPGIGEGAENVVDAEFGDGLMTYYVVVNSVMNTLATLVLDGLAAEETLIAEWRDFLVAARSATPGDATLYDRLLHAPELTCKANFATSASGVNEAEGDARGQAAVFITLPNPVVDTEPA